MSSVTCHKGATCYSDSNMSKADSRAKRAFPAPRPSEIREADRETIAQMFLEGRTTDYIAAHFLREQGRELSTALIAADWNAVRKQWAAQRSEDVAVYMSEELHAINRMLAEAWDRYNEVSKSLKNKSFAQKRTTTMDEDIEVDADIKMMTARKMKTSEILRSREQAFKEQAFWWTRIEDLHRQRQKIMGIGRAGMTFFIDNRQTTNIAAVKGYSGVSPDDWPEPGQLLPENTVVDDGMYEVDDD